MNEAIKRTLAGMDESVVSLRAVNRKKRKREREEEQARLLEEAEEKKESFALLNMSRSANSPAS